jgi:hypothetical protein
LKGSSGIAWAAVLCAAASAHPLHAASITTVNLGTVTSSTTTSGTLPNQSQVLEAVFTLGSTTSLTIDTSSYSTGGFQPMITLFDSTGRYVAGEQVTSPVAANDPTTGLALDAYLFDANLSAGTYDAVLTDWLNQQPPTATNLSDGFVNLGPGGSTFVDEQLNSRNGSYALSISVPAASPVPEPATFWLVLPVLAGAAILVRRRQRASAL